MGTKNKSHSQDSLGETCSYKVQGNKFIETGIYKVVSFGSLRTPNGSRPMFLMIFGKAWNDGLLNWSTYQEHDKTS